MDVDYASMTFWRAEGREMLGRVQSCGSGTTIHAERERKLRRRQQESSEYGMDLVVVNIIENEEGRNTTITGQQRSSATASDCELKLS